MRDFRKFLLILLLLQLSIQNDVQIKQDEKTLSEEQSITNFLDIRTLISMLLVSVLVGMCQAGGIGGGPIISPVMIGLLGIGQRRAVWDTYILLFGGSIGSYLKLRRERMQETGSSLINYKLVLVTMPLLLSGAVFGVAAGKFLPKVFIGVLLFLILSQVIFKSYKSYKRVRAQEIERDKFEKNKETKGTWIELQFVTEEFSFLDTQTAYSYTQQAITKPQDVSLKEDIMAEQLQLTSLTSPMIFKSHQLLQLHENEKILIPVNIVLQMILIVSFVIFLQIMKGTKVIPSFIGIQYCSINYHLMNILLLVMGLLYVMYFKKKFKEEELNKDNIGYDFKKEGRLSQFVDSSVTASFYAGFLGGLVGLGGGTVLTPLWLEMGMPSQRAAASASFCVLFTSLVSLSVQVMVGAYTLNEIIFLIIVSMGGSYIVSGQLKTLVTKYKRESLIIQTLLFVILFGMLILPYNLAKDIVQNPEEAIKFGQFC